MRLQYLGGLLAAATVASPAAAQEAGASLMLLCNGTDAVPATVNTGLVGGRYYYGALAQGRVAAQLGVSVDGGKVRVRPPKSSTPLFAKDSDDGWYELTGVTVDRLSIKGRLKWNRIDRVRLDVDRRSGMVSFGEFSGVCQSVSTNPDATKF